MSQILVFGDSRTYGAFDSRAGGWVDRLKAFLFRQGRNTEYFIYNVGISGNTTADLLERFGFETKQRIKDKEDKEEAIFIFDIGANDSAWMHSRNNHWVPPNRFKKNIKKLIQLAQNFSPKIVFVGLIPIEESKTTLIPWNTDISYKNEFFKRYDEIVKSICKENKIYFIEMFEKFLKLDYKKLLEDGVHPNAEGHEKIFEMVKEFLIENKII